VRNIDMPLKKRIFLSGYINKQVEGEKITKRLDCSRGRKRDALIGFWRGDAMR